MIDNILEVLREVKKNTASVDQWFVELLRDSLIRDSEETLEDFWITYNFAAAQIVDTFDRVVESMFEVAGVASIDEFVAKMDQ